MTHGLLFIEADSDWDALAAKLAYYSDQPQWRIALLCDLDEMNQLGDRVRRQFPRIEIPPPADRITQNHLKLMPDSGHCYGFIPAELGPVNPACDEVETGCIQPLIGKEPASPHNFREHTKLCRGWVAHRSLLEAALTQHIGWDALSIAAANHSKAAWMSGRTHQEPWPQPKGPPALSSHAALLVIVTHFGCEDTLAATLQALSQQTRKPDAVAVIDDASPTPPLDIVAGFPGVSLYGSRENVGPFRLANQILRQTQFDAYLHQDADDWCARDRIALLLDAAMRHDAAIIGANCLHLIPPQDLSPAQRQFAPNGVFLPVAFPADAGHALSFGFRHAACHGTLLITRKLWSDLGGYSGTPRFGADTDFLLRASHVTPILNLAAFSYYRRMRAGSLTRAKTTGFQSQARQELNAKMTARHEQNLKSNHPVLTPLSPARGVRLEHLYGPALHL